MGFTKSPSWDSSKEFQQEILWKVDSRQGKIELTDSLNRTIPLGPPMKESKEERLVWLCWEKNSETATTTKVIRKQKKLVCPVTYSKVAKDLEHIQKYSENTSFY